VGCAASDEQNTIPQGEAIEMTRDQILALERRRFKAMCEGDAGALDELLHRDLTYTHSTGAVDRKDSYTSGVRERLWDYRSIKTSDEIVSIHGGTALIHCRLRIDLTVKDVPKTVDSVALTVWVEDAGRWQVAAVHSTPYPQQ
jgi:ketosteroid isomerase-like protein